MLHWSAVGINSQIKPSKKLRSLYSLTGSRHQPKTGNRLLGPSNFRVWHGCLVRTPILEPTKEQKLEGPGRRLGQQHLPAAQSIQLTLPALPGAGFAVPGWATGLGLLYLSFRFNLRYGFLVQIYSCRVASTVDLWALVSWVLCGCKVGSRPVTQ